MSKSKSPSMPSLRPMHGGGVSTDKRLVIVKDEGH